jgi:hypothetical protein
VREKPCCRGPRQGAPAWSGAPSAQRSARAPPAPPPEEANLRLERERGREREKARPSPPQEAAGPAARGRAAASAVGGRGFGGRGPVGSVWLVGQPGRSELAWVRHVWSGPPSTFFFVERFHPATRP